MHGLFAAVAAEPAAETAANIRWRPFQIQPINPDPTF